MLERLKKSNELLELILKVQLLCVWVWVQVINCSWQALTTPICTRASMNTLRRRGCTFHVSSSSPMMSFWRFYLKQRTQHGRQIIHCYIGGSGLEEMRKYVESVCVEV